MSIKTNEAYGYFLVPLNASGIPGNKSTARTVNMLGPDGTYDDGVPGVLTYTPQSDTYGMVTLKDMRVENDLNIEGAMRIHCYVLYIDERDLLNPITMGALDDAITPLDFAGSEEDFPDDCFVLLADSDKEEESVGNTSPAPIVTEFAAPVQPEDQVVYVKSAQGFPTDSVFDIYFSDTIEGMQVVGGFGSTEWLVTRAIQGTADFHPIGTVVSHYPTPTGTTYDFRRYECGQIIKDENGVRKWHRHYLYDPRPTRSYFDAFVTAHEAGKKLYRLRVQHFSMAVRREEVYTEGLPAEFPMVLPNACVVATVAAVENYYGYGPFTNYNCGVVWDDALETNPPSPGIRTCNGASYKLPYAGELQIASNASPFMIQDLSPIRCIYATVDTAPLGASIIIAVKISKDYQQSWTVLERLTIAVGKMYSFDETGDNVPANRRMPFVMEWPTTILEEDNVIAFDIEQVGSTTPGSDLNVYVQT